MLRFIKVANLLFLWVRIKKARKIKVIIFTLKAAEFSGNDSKYGEI